MLFGREKNERLSIDEKCLFHLQTNSQKGVCPHATNVLKLYRVKHSGEKQKQKNNTMHVPTDSTRYTRLHSHMQLLFEVNA